ncbi:hypothetical protein [Methylobacterium currus]|uniref:hypothetical protein n=1 Tax=Methylobacterium currus TaxID=2051553 RepID=UPI000F4DC8B6|nr:hypothetical protein [Methylobacterium currus]
MNAFLGLYVVMGMIGAPAVQIDTISPAPLLGSRSQPNVIYVGPFGRRTGRTFSCQLEVRCGSIIAEGQGEDIAAAMENAIGNAEKRAAAKGSDFDIDSCKPINEEACDQ